MEAQSSVSDSHSSQAFESLRAMCEQADQALEGHRESVSGIQRRLNEQLQQLSELLENERSSDEQLIAECAEKNATIERQRAEINELQQRLQSLESELNGRHSELSGAQDELARQASEFEQQLAERDEELAGLLEIGEAENQQLADLQQELADALETIEQLHNQESLDAAARDREMEQLRQESAQTQDRLSILQEDYKLQQAEVEAAQQQLQETQTELSHRLEELAKKQRELDEALQQAEVVQQAKVEVDEALSSAEAKISELQLLAETAEEESAELKQLRRKFDLALADVHKLKRENAQLNEELQSRPEVSEQESPELVSLRAERDALAERIVELENAPQPEADPSTQQELEDLQRRFEMAVDDVRQLKQENNELREKLRSAPSPGAKAAHDGPLDWQAQKAKLLAELDAEDQGFVEESRQQERASIEGTISITDQVVAEKDAKLAELEQKLSELQSHVDAVPEERDLEKLREEIAAELLADDEAVKTETERLQAKHSELEAKLRQAELDLSLERAKLARERAAIEERLASFDTDEHSQDSLGADKPKRRWLSALGLKEEKEEQ